MTEEIYSEEMPETEAMPEDASEAAQPVEMGDVLDELDKGNEEDNEDDAVELEDDEDDDTDGDDDDDEADDDVDDEPSVTDEELDQIADTAIAALEDILKYFDIGEVTIDEYEGDEGELILDITGDDLAVLIGRHGKTLDALQFIISSITARAMGFRYPVVVDVEGYKGRQRQKLENLAFSTAKRALSQNRSMKMRPMTPYERRIVHIALREFDGVSTASEGEGGARHVVVIPD